MIAVNPDPSRFAGVLLLFAVEDLPAIVRAARGGDPPVPVLAMAEVRLSDGQRLLAVNDLFLGPRRHTAAAYVLQHGQRSEAQWSSRLIGSSGLEATGWLGRTLAGAAALGGALGQPLDPRPLTEGLTWDSRHLLFAVREPYAGTAGRTELVYGRVDARTPLVLESRMAEEGVIFSDGMLDDALQRRDKGRGAGGRRGRAVGGVGGYRGDRCLPERGCVWRLVGYGPARRLGARIAGTPDQ